MKKRIKDMSGVLLLEAIFCVVILVITLSVIIESLVSGLRASVLTADYSRAIILADNLMTEILQAQKVPASLPAQASFPEPQEKYSYTLKTDAAVPEEESPLVQAELRVQWTSGRKGHDISLVTWLGEPPAKENE